MNERKRLGILAIIGPGILVAATGVGAGDLATGAFTGNKLQLAVLWAVVIGAGLKFTLNEGLARWQLATGETLLEGCVERFGPIVQGVFFLYLLFWSFFVGSALMSACGVTANAMFPLFDTDTPGGLTALQKGKIVYGLLHSALGVILVLAGGYRLLGKVMGVCISAMFVTVIITAIRLSPDWGDVATGLLVPSIPQATGAADPTLQGLIWTIALMGGVGGTLTVLCYGYWIREEGRQGAGALRTCRIDLAVAYTLTAVFGICMVIIGSKIEITGQGSGLIVALAKTLGEELGPVGMWAFVIGAWGAVFSSLFGVWQSVPYLFTDFCELWRRGGKEKAIQVDTKSLSYRGYLLAIATIPAIGLWSSFENMQKLYALVGAAFLPMLAAALLALNGPRRWVGENRNRIWTNGVLVATLAFFIASGWFAVRKTFQ